MINLTSILPDHSGRPRLSRRLHVLAGIQESALGLHWRRDRRVMELAEPRVRTGVWEHTNFRLNPIRRLRRTGGAAMMTIYGARSAAEAMIARVRRMHDLVAGTTPSGEVYRTNDPELLNWVQGTAAYSFLQAYHVYVQPLSLMERDRYYAEAVPAARLYGATSIPISEAELEMLFHATADRLEPSHIVFEFLSIMRSAPILPLLLRPAQHLLVRAAVDLVPPWAQTTLGLDGQDFHTGKPKWSSKQQRSQTASFWHQARRFRPVGGCAFPTIISIKTRQYAGQAKAHLSDVRLIEWLTPPSCWRRIPRSETRRS